MNDYSFAAANPDFIATGQSRDAGEIDAWFYSADATSGIELNGLEPPRDAKKARTRDRTKTGVEKRQIGQNRENIESDTKPENAPRLLQPGRSFPKGRRGFR